MNLKEAFSVKGYDQMDVYYEEAEAKALAINSNNIKNFESNFTKGFGVRVIVRDKVGFSYTNDIRKLKDAVKQAIKIAKFSNTKVKLERFSKYPKVKGIFDKKLVGLGEEILVELAKQGLSLARDRKCYVTEGGLSASSGKTVYVNSDGLELEEKDTAYSCSVNLKSEYSPGWWFFESNSFVKNFLDVVEKACKMAKDGETKGVIKTGKYDVVLHPYACDAVFSNGVYPLFNSDYVQKDRSPFKDRIGEKVASEKLTIYDDGIMGGGLNSGSFDGDGVPSQKTLLVDKGILKNFIYDLTRAQKENKKSTGNALRTFNGLPYVGVTNFSISPGTRDLVKEVDRGLLVLYPLNAHTIDPVTGDFSLGIDKGFWIEKGEIKFSPKAAMISGSIQDFLKNIKMVGKDVMQTGGYAGPSLLGEMNVTGG